MVSGVVSAGGAPGSLPPNAPTITLACAPSAAPPDPFPAADRQHKKRGSLDERRGLLSASPVCGEAAPRPLERHRSGAERRVSPDLRGGRRRGSDAWRGSDNLAGGGRGRSRSRSPDDYELEQRRRRRRQQRPTREVVSDEELGEMSC